MFSSSKPILIEPGMKYFLSQTLEKCHQFRVKHENTLYNISLFLLFILFIMIFLLLKWKGFKTQEEIEQQENEKKNYILSKIRNYQENKQKHHQQIITGLPSFQLY
jgi:hypothetical protein